MIPVVVKAYIVKYAETSHWIKQRLHNIMITLRFFWSPVHYSLEILSEIYNTTTTSNSYVSSNGVS